MNEVSGYFSQYNDPTWNLIYSVSWFPYERPDRPSRLKKVFTRSGRSYGNATQTIANNPDDLDPA